MYAFICITNIILANWPEFLRNCRSQSLHSWVKKLQWDGSNLSHFHGEGCDWANHPKSTKSLDDLDVRYQHGSSPKIFQVSTHHFFQLQRLFALKVIFKPWQPCCFRTEKRYIHFHLAWQHCHDFEFQIRKAKPENCATPGGRSIEYIYHGMTRYVLHICCLDNYLAQRVARKILHKPKLLRTQRVALKKEFQDLWKKKGQNSAM